MPMPSSNHIHQCDFGLRVVRCDMMCRCGIGGGGGMVTGGGMTEGEGDVGTCATVCSPDECDGNVACDGTVASDDG